MTSEQNITDSTRTDFAFLILHERRLLRIPPFFRREVQKVSEQFGSRPSADFAFSHIMSAAGDCLMWILIYVRNLKALNSYDSIFETIEVQAETLVI